MLKVIGYVLLAAGGLFLLTAILLPVCLMIHSLIVKVRRDRAELARFELETRILENQAKHKHLTPNEHGFSGSILDLQTGKVQDLDARAVDLATLARQRILAAMSSLRITRNVPEILTPTDATTDFEFLPYSESEAHSINIGE